MQYKLGYWLVHRAYDISKQPSSCSLTEFVIITHAPYPSPKKIVLYTRPSPGGCHFSWEIYLLNVQNPRASGVLCPPGPPPNNFASPISNSWLRPCIARKASFYSFFGHIIKIENGIVPVNPTERILMKIDYFLSNLSNLINNLRISSWWQIPKTREWIGLLRHFFLRILMPVVTIASHILHRIK